MKKIRLLLADDHRWYFSGAPVSYRIEYLVVGTVGDGMSSSPLGGT
jgi:hypothetical protein